MSKAAAKKPDTVASEGETEISPVARVARANPVQLSAQEINPAGARWQTWEIKSHANHDIEDVLHPRYLWAKSEQIKPGDVVIVKHALDQFVVVLDVLAIDHHTRGIITHTRYAREKDQEAVNKPDARSWTIDQTAPDNWRVLDGTYVVQENFLSRRQAELWIAQQQGAA